MALDDSKNIIKIVGHPRCQLPNRFQLLRMTKLRFQAEPFGRVASVAVNDLARGNREERPRESAAFDANLLVRFALAESQALLRNGDCLVRKECFGIFQLERARHFSGGWV